MSSQVMRPGCTSAATGASMPFGSGPAVPWEDASCTVAAGGYAAA